MRNSIPVIVLQYGKLELTRKCIESLRAQTAKVWVILVDGCTPNVNKTELSELGKLADEVVIHQKNYGYAKGNNLVIRKVLDSSEYFMVLNNDTELEPDCIQKMLDLMESNPKIGQVGPKVFYYNGKLQSVGGDIKQPLFEPYLIGHLEGDSAFITDREVGYVSGVAMLIRSDAAKLVGPIPEQYFMYGEDVDWSLGFKKFSYESWFCAGAKLKHYESASTGVFKQIKGYYLTRSNIWLARKWLFATEFKKFQGLFFQKLLRQTVKYFKHPAYVLGLWKGYFEGFNGIPKTSLQYAEGWNDYNEDLTPGKVDVVIVNYKTKDYTKSAVESVLHEKCLVKVIVVDNDSGDGSIEYLKDYFKGKKVEIVARDKNDGFGAGNNAGIRRATSEYVFCLNSDAEIEQESLDSLVAEMQKDSRLGLLAPEIFLPGGKIKQKDSQGWFPNSKSIILRKDKAYIEDLNPDWVSGVAFLARTKEFKDLGGFDPNFFMYFEDIELCWRYSGAGFKIGRTVSAKVFHHGGVSKKSKVWQKDQYYRSQDYYLKVCGESYWNRLLVRIIRYPYYLVGKHFLWK